MSFAMAERTTLKKPALRGVSHAVGAILVVPILFLVVRNTTSSTAITAAWIHGCSVLFLLAASAIYHVPHWQPRTRMWLRRIDHSAIFILIAGTYTPLCLLALPSGGNTLLSIVWITAGFGIVQSMLWPHAPRWVTVPLYLSMGWVLVLYAPEFFRNVETLLIVLVITGGALYTIGALTYARRWPNPKPAVFGYHEIFHLFVLAALACHYVVVWHLVSKS